MSVWLERLLGTDIDDAHSIPLANHYTAAGLIVWYCLVSLCCGAPLLCLSIWFLYKHCRVPVCNDNVVDDVDLDLQISQIEANISAFSEIEKKMKRATLLTAFEKHIEVSNEVRCLDCS